MAKARLVDVARAANVSPGAVWRTLANDPKLSIAPKTRSRILAAAKELAYVSDARARQLRKGVSTVVGVLTHDLRGSYAAQFLYYISLQMAEMGKEVILGVHTGDTELARYHLSRFRAYQTCGLLVISSSPEPAEWVAACRDDVRTGCGPVITVSFGGDVGNRPGLHIDYEWECERFIRMAAADGRAEAVMARRAVTASFAEKFLNAAPDVRLRRHVIDALPSDPSALAGMVIPRLVEARRRGPVAVMTSVDTDAVVIVQELGKCGLSVPQDVSVLGYGNLLVSQISSPAISTVDASGTVKIMADKVIELFKLAETSKTLEEKEYPFRPGLVVRESFIPPPGWDATD